MFLFLLCDYSLDGVTYESHEKKVLKKITLTTIKPTFKVLSSVERIVAGQAIDSAFYICRENIEEITFGENSQLNTVDNCFLSQTSVKTCDMSNCANLLILSESAFSGCWALSKLILPPNLEEIKASCIQSTVLVSIDFPNSLKKLGQFSFTSNLKLTTININKESKLETLDPHVFMYTAITSFFFPKSFKTFGAAPFLYCSVTSYTIDPLNPTFTVDAAGKTLYLNESEKIVSVVNGFNDVYTIESSVKIIGYQAFRGCRFSSIIIPKGVTTIEGYAFSATSITSIDIPEGVTAINGYAFDGSSVTTITLPDSLTSITSWCFANANSLTTITLPPTLESIGDSAFSGCNSLTQITIPESVVTFGVSVFSLCNKNLEVTFENSTRFQIKNEMLFVEGSKLAEYFGKDNADIVIPSFCTLIPNRLFSCKSIGKVTFEDGVTNMVIAEKAFEKSTIQAITFPPTLSSLGKECFSECPNIQTIDFSGTDVTIIPERCFFSCPKLTTLILTDSNVITIQKEAFRDSQITNFNVQQSKLDHIGQHAFYNTKITSITFPLSIATLDVYAFSLCQDLETVSFDGCVHITQLSKFLFEKCYKLREVTLGPNITTLGDNCFSNCYEIETLTLSPGTVTLETHCLLDCIGLTTIVIPEGSLLKSIKPFALKGCNKLSRFDIRATDKFSFENDLLMNAEKTNIIFYLPTTKKTSMIISGKVEVINEYSFKSAHNLRELIVSDGALKKIGFEAFTDCINLRRIFLPNQQIEIDSDAFKGCNKLICGCVVIPSSLHQSAIKKGKIPEGLLQEQCQMKECNVMVDSITCNNKSYSSFNHLPQLLIAALLSFSS